MADRFKVEHLLAVYFQRVQGKPYMEVRFFSAPREDAAVTMAFFVPPSIRAASQTAQFSGSRDTANRPAAKQRSLLSRLLGGDLDPNSYSSAESSIPLREIARQVERDYPEARVQVEVRKQYRNMRDGIAKRPEASVSVSRIVPFFATGGWRWTMAERSSRTRIS